MTTTLTLFAMLVASLNGPTTSLAEVARREAIRRQLMPPPAVVLTNESLPEPRYSDRPAPPADASPAPDTAATPAADATLPVIGLPPAPPQAATAPAATEPVHDEAWWRGRMTDIRKAITDGEATIERLQSRVNAITTDVASHDDPAQREMLRLELSKDLGELDRARTKLDQDRASVDTLRRDARREGALPGWVR
jgi:hypothetical protein